MNLQAKLPRRSPLVDVANRVFPAIWKTRAMPRPELDAEQLCADVAEETGLEDFGSDWFRKPLEVLVEAIHEEASLNALGEFAADGQFRKVLRDRLWTQHWLDTYPEIGRRALHRPVFVVGAMRSGTTRLHRLLASDDRFSHMRFFETISPTPSPRFRKGKKDWRPFQASMLLGLVHRLNPVTAAIHPTGSFEPEEELGLLVASMWGMKHEAQWHVPSYGRWAERQDATPAYRHMANLLRLVGWARGDDDMRPWVLKTPQHMLDLPALLRVFPDARIIFTHREPQAVVGSSCSLVRNQMVIHSDSVDAEKVGREWLRKTALQIERMQQAREQIPEAQRIDVRYRDMDRDWQGVMRRVYRFLDMDIEPAMPEMTSYIDNAERKRSRHPHRYSLAAFGLDENEVEERFRPYSRAFDLRKPSLVSVPKEEGVSGADTPVPAFAATKGWDGAKAAVVAARTATARR